MSFRGGSRYQCNRRTPPPLLYDRNTKKTIKLFLYCIEFGSLSCSLIKHILFNYKIYMLHVRNRYINVFHNFFMFFSSAWQTLLMFDPSLIYPWNVPVLSGKYRISIHLVFVHCIHSSNCPGDYKITMCKISLSKLSIRNILFSDSKWTYIYAI